MNQGAERKIVVVIKGGSLTNCTLNINLGEKEERPEENYEGVRKSLLEYVGRLMPVVADKYKAQFMKIWTEILEQEAVSSLIYDRGRQQGTIFNRNLVAQIAHMMVGDIILEGTSIVRMTELLEPQDGKKHPVRGALAVSPDDKRVKKAVNEVLKRYSVKVL